MSQSYANSAVINTGGELSGTQKTILTRRLWEIGVDSVLKPDGTVKNETASENKPEAPRQGHLLSTLHGRPSSTLVTGRCQSSNGGQQLSKCRTAMSDEKPSEPVLASH
jgi:hypothetical protein